MGCGGSRELLTQAEKPLEHWMEPLDMEGLDRIFSSASNIIINIEEKRSAIVDELDNVYSNSGAIAYKNRDLNKALRCAFWKLGVDNAGKIDEIGFNLDNQQFEGGKNTEEGNLAGNTLIIYCKNLVENLKVEDLDNNLNDITNICKDLSENYEKYLQDTSEYCKDNPFEGFKKISIFRGNMSKCTKVISCLKDLIVILKNLTASASGILATINPVGKANEIANIEIAFKLKLTHPVQIAWILIEKDEEKYEKNGMTVLRIMKKKLKLNKPYLINYTSKN